MSSWVGWMRWNHTEIANANRVLSYLGNGLGCDTGIMLSGSDIDCECDAIDEGPYVDPATDDAPWYTASRPESADFLGVFLSEIQLNAPWGRSTQEAGKDGSILGRQRLRGRTMGFSAWLIANTPPGLEYGKRWLAEALASCDLGEMCLLPSCPGEGIGPDDTDAFRTFKKVGLLNGPTEVQIGDRRDLITQMDWQMSSEIGYMYADAIACLEDSALGDDGSICCGLSTEDWLGNATAKITLKSGGPDYVDEVRITATPTKDGACGPTSGGVLGDAQASWKVSGSSAASLLDDSGNGHDLVLPGGTADPLFLKPEPNNFQKVYLPGAFANSLTSPDSVALSIVGDIDLRAWIAPDDWTPAINSVVLGKWGSGGANQQSYQLILLTTGVLRLSWSTTGSNELTADSTVANTFVNGTDHWVRATLDVADGANRVITFYVSEDGISWTQLGAVVTTAGNTSIFNGSWYLAIGNSAEANYLVGNVYRAQVYNGISGTLVFDADMTDREVLEAPFATFLEKSSSAAIVTVNRGSTGRKTTVVDRPMFLLGTNDYLSAPDHADLDFLATDSFTVLVVGRLYGDTVDQTILSKRTAGAEANAGYSLHRGSVGNTPEFEISDGVVETSDVAGVLTQGQVFEVAGVRRVSADQVEAWSEGAFSGTPTTDATTTTLANAIALRIGSFGGGTAFADFELFGAAIFRRALTSQEIVAASSELVSDQIVTGTPCLDVTINQLPPGTVLTIDGSERTVSVRRVSSGEVIGGMDFLTFDGLWAWPDMGPCMTMCVCLEFAEVNPNSTLTVEQFNREA